MPSVKQACIESRIQSRSYVWFVAVGLFDGVCLVRASSLVPRPYDVVLWIPPLNSKMSLTVLHIVAYLYWTSVVDFAMIAHASSGEDVWRSVLHILTFFHEFVVFKNNNRG